MRTAAPELAFHAFISKCTQRLQLRFPAGQYSYFLAVLGNSKNQSALGPRAQTEGSKCGVALLLPCRLLPRLSPFTFSAACQVTWVGGLGCDRGWDVSLLWLSTDAAYKV